MYKAILSLHAFPGCNTTSSISGKGKITFFNFTKNDAGFMLAVTELGNSPDILTDLMAKFEKGLCRI